MQPGRILDFLDKGNDNRRACSLYLSMMDRMGVKLDRFGDTDKAPPRPLRLVGTGLWPVALHSISASALAEVHVFAIPAQA